MFLRVKTYIWPESINIQLVPLHSHWINATKRAITTFKEHLIVALTTIDIFSPLSTLG